MAVPLSSRKVALSRLIIAFSPAIIPFSNYVIDVDWRERTPMYGDSSVVWEFKCPLSEKHDPYLLSVEISLLIMQSLSSR